MKRISFLKAWKQKFAMKATYRALMESLLGIKRVEDARGVCQVLKDSQNAKGNILEGIVGKAYTVLASF